MKDEKCHNCVRMTVAQDEYINIMEEQCRDYEEQIEKLKDCSNCKHCNYSNRILTYVCDIGDIIGDTMPDYTHCDEWEMKE